MAFEGLTVKEAMREIRLALLEADVSYKVVKDFVAKVSERAVGSDVLESLTPAQMIVKIVNEELTALMGGSDAKLNISSKPPTVVMLVGLQGAGKTTLPSSSCRWWADSWTSLCSRWARPTRWTSPRPPSPTPRATATTWCFWIPPAVSMWTRR